MTDEKFALGRIVATPAALAAIGTAEIFTALKRHAGGDWGIVPEEDKRENELSLVENSRLISAYLDRNGNSFWIITEADRSSTTVLLPEEY